tara:strand:+ start:978 stop:1211 length:234 start_codon:yes stop_codon:yes gene_type:complete
MRNIVLSIFLLTGLNACSVPLLGSLTSSGITGAATGKYQQSLANSAVDMLVHHNTGHTPSELLFMKLKGQKKPAPHS